MKIVAIYDSGENSTLDSIAVITDDRNIFIGTVAFLGTDGTNGKGFSQWGEIYEKDICMLSNDKTELVFHDNTHIGKRIHFEDLPQELQKHIAQRILL